ncbi:MAG TPA: type III pantothenate kinase [Candidatus Competibacteraceae bacterium]|nr:type III pantothenate kinase [Candidatus Competibacteraceae bacterium]HRZ05474.1 type III pantothenate kinase [Candidatus Competibacteraceae bacterium]HSA47225.1 type III pantothenate kinase [Candidatus Competibacteraceae bacterium]
MIFLADVGNSRIKWAVWDGSGFQQRGQASHGAENWTEWAERQWRALPPPQRALMVSVAGPEARSAFTDWIQKSWGIEAQFVGSTTAACGVRNAYAEPERLGADRWVALIAARSLTRQSCYVVDCGTAVTIDALAADGQHLGGVIVPGMRLMREALYRETRQIPPETGEPRLFGQSTREGVWGGALYAVASTIDGITERMIANHGSGLRLLTGGDAEGVLPYLQAAYQLEPELIFTGLRVIAGEA